MAAGANSRLRLSTYAWHSSSEDRAPRQGAYHVRLAGINAPERKQPFSEADHQDSAALVLLRDVVVD